jgi:hypothetical protein
MDGRDADGYHARSRLEARRSWRGRLTIAVAAAAIALWAVTTLTAPQHRSVADASPGSISSGSPGPQNRGPTYPADVERFPGMRAEVIPGVAFGGLSWLDTTRPETSRSMEPEGAAEWAFIWPDGNAGCICFRPGAEDVRARHLRWFSPGGEPNADLPLDDWPFPTGRRVLTAVAWDPTAAAFYLAWAELSSGGWTVHLELRDSNGARHATVTLEEGVFADLDAVTPVSMNVAIAPDGRHARVGMVFAPFETPTPGRMRAWIVPIDGATLRTPRALPDMPRTGRCLMEGWATADYYAQLCSDGGAGDREELLLVRDADGGRRETFKVAASPRSDWLLDEVRGRYYLWEDGRDRLVRLDVVEPATTSRTVDGSSLAQTFTPEAAWPSRPATSTVWAPRGAGPFDPEQFQDTPGVPLRRLVASRDGNIIIYAAGAAPSPTDLQPPQSDGLWAFDAESLAVLGHWDPVGEYDAVALTPDGRYVIALGDASLAEIQAFGNHGRTIAFHDARTGELGLVIRHDVSARAFLVPEPFP